MDTPTITSEEYNQQINQIPEENVMLDEKDTVTENTAFISEESVMMNTSSTIENVISQNTELISTTQDDVDNITSSEVMEVEQYSEMNMHPQTELQTTNSSDANTATPEPEPTILNMQELSVNPAAEITEISNSFENQEISTDNAVVISTEVEQQVEISQTFSEIITTEGFIQVVSSTEHPQYTIAEDLATHFTQSSENIMSDHVNIDERGHQEALEVLPVEETTQVVESSTDDTNLIEAVQSNTVVQDHKIEQVESSADLEKPDTTQEMLEDVKPLTEPSADNASHSTTEHQNSETNEVNELDIIINDEQCKILESKCTIQTAEDTSMQSEPDSKNSIELSEESQESTTLTVEEIEYSGNETVYVHEGNFQTLDGQQVYIVDNVIVMEHDDINPEEPVQVTSQTDNIEVQLEKINEGKNQPSEPVQKVPLPEIPSHVLGRNIENPVDDALRNGRPPPKPRLGVKVPYRNLTSQIVSRQEIINEVLKRQQVKQSDPASSGNTLFAKKLTQRLAKKITQEPTKDPVPEKETAVQKQNKVKIETNSDLLAILEGDGEDISLGESTEQVDSLKILEKQIALKQLREMSKPKRLGRKPNPQNILSDESFANFYKDTEIIKSIDTTKPKEGSETSEKNKVNSTNQKVRPKETVEKKENDVNINAGMKNSTRNNSAVNTVKKTDVATVQKSKDKTEASTSTTKSSPGRLTKESSKNTSLSNEVSAGDDLDTIPKFSTTMVVKTYSRKRKLTEDEEKQVPVSIKKTINSQLQSSNKPENSEVYVTKSSRVIKKKVIWDPDETPSPKGTFKSPSKVESKVATPALKVKRVQKQPVAEEVPTTSSSQKADTVLNKEKVLEGKKIKIIKKTVIEKQKRLSEIDKLLMDEGAIKMLYEMKKPDENQNTGKQKKKMIVDVEKAEKDLLNKSNELKNDLQINSVDSKISPKSLRRKDMSIIKTPEKPVTPASVSRQKSKDSNRSSIHSPPPSPAMVYPEASRIIRRHSSSSYSSEEEIDENSTNTQEIEKSGRKKTASTTLEGSKPKRMKKTENVVINEKKRNEDSAKKFAKLKQEETAYKTLTVKYMDNLAQIILVPNKQHRVYLTGEVLKDLTSAIHILNEDNDCHVILISSSGNSFCHGINYKELVAEKEGPRKASAKDLANSVKTFLKALAHSKKILVAGVHGDVEGLGVMMLPLFDTVIASDTATFSTPYGKLGCVPEGSYLFTLPSLMSSVLISELLLAPRKLIATEAQRVGLISRILWPDKFQEEIVSSSKLMANQSLQFLEAVKKISRDSVLGVVEKGLEAETEMLIKHWTSAECQKNFSQYL